MKKKTKHWLFGILAVIVVGFAGLNVIAYNHARAMTRFTGGGSRTGKPENLSGVEKARVLLMGVNVPRPRSDLQPSDLDPECRRLSIRCPDGVTLGCWYVDRGEKTPLVVLFHGYGAEKTCLLPEAQAFLKLGKSVLLVDFRGSGESSEAYTTIGFHCSPIGVGFE
jgi:pimeloyl-ACP methyl ester carboxylesterase